MLVAVSQIDQSQVRGGHQAIPALHLGNVFRSFARGAITAVNGVSLDVQPGEILSILGPSGCGKTTTMRLIAGLDEPTSGDIRIFGKSVLGIPPHRRGIGLVFQSLAIFPHMTVRQNVAFGLRMQGIAPPEIKAKVERMLDLVHLPPVEFAARMPSQLSGGQLQRVALARTLVTEPALVLFDEPMAALDRRLRDYMAAELRAIQKKLGIAAVYVTHDQETASAMSDRIAIMRSGQIEQIDTPSQIYERPRNRFVAEFLGDVNLLEPSSIGPLKFGKRTISLGGNTLTIQDDDSSAIERPLVMFRPEHVTVSPKAEEGGALEGTIISIQFSSGSYRWTIRLGDGQDIVAKGVETKSLHAGDKAWVVVKPRFAKLLRQ